MHEQVFLGLGSNLGDSSAHLRESVDLLTANEQIQLLALSSLYVSAPMGPQDQPDYINAVCQISTTLDPHELLDFCQQTEKKMGRVKSDSRWGPRIVDIDILLFGDEHIESKQLTIPHQGIAQREFVLVPLFELVPALIMPDGQPLAKWVAACSLDGLKRIR